MLSEARLDAYFDQIKSDAFRFEALDHYGVAVESDLFRSYLAGEPEQVGRTNEWFEFIHRETEAGRTFRKVHIVRGPLSDYLRFEFEWSYPVSERYGQRAYVLDLTEVAESPEFPPYDFWMLDEQTVLRMHYDAHGVFLGASLLDESATARHVRYRDELLTAATPFETYWAAHPQYWRKNWLTAPK